MPKSLVSRWMAGRVVGAAALVLTALAVGALPALADAPDPIVSQTHLVGQPTHNPDGSLTVTIAGAWQWTTHHSNCNTDRSGVGYAIAWNDPSDPGNLVGTNTLNTLVGTTVSSAPGSAPWFGVNRQDGNLVHPTPNTAGAFNDPGLGPTMTYSTTTHLNPNQTDANNWISGCGTFNGTFNSGTWGPISHTYPAGTGPITVCPIMYDPHQGPSGTANANAGQITAGGSGRNSDNSIQTNGDTPLGNGCFATTFPSLTTTATDPATAGAPVRDVAHLQGTNPTGTIVFKLYPAGDTTCAQAPIYDSSSSPVTVNGNGDFRSPTPDPVPPGVGSYNWRAFYSGDAHNNPVSTPCGDSNETTTVIPASPALTTNASAGGRLGTAVSDVAHLSGTTPAAGGTITFKLYSAGDTMCAMPLFTSSAVSVSGSGSYTSPAFTPTSAGTYQWVAAYSGDASNGAAASGCNDSNEAVVITPPPAQPLTPGIAVAKFQRIDGTPDPYTSNQLIVQIGQKVDYEMVVSNTGDLPLALSFSDPHCDAGTLTGPTGDLNPDGSLKPHGQATYFCSHIALASDQPTLTNTVTVSGQPPSGPPVGPVSASVVAQIPSQQVAPSCVVGPVALNGTVGCARRAFQAVVQAAPNSVRSVTFRLDGKVVRTLTHVGSGNRWALTIHPRQLRLGGHTLTAVVTLVCNGARRTVTLHFRHCAPPKPRFTG